MLPCEAVFKVHFTSYSLVIPIAGIVWNKHNASQTTFEYDLPDTALVFAKDAPNVLCLAQTGILHYVKSLYR